MKKIFLLILVLLSTTSLMSCSDSNSTKADEPDVDKTTSCQSGDEDGRFDTFFKPPVGWFGDPIPFFDNGKFYLYYLQDWRDIHPYLHPWHLITSTDLSSFDYEGEVLPVGKNTAQDASLCTGSIIKSRENGYYYMFYAGHKFNNNPETPLQAVMLAISTDLKNWTKDETFYLSITGDGYNWNDFRDPFLYFDEESNLYKMLVTTQRDGKGTLALYTSTDLYHWDLQEPFYTDPDVHIVECADVFKEGNFWYLIYSNVRDRKVHYKYSSSQNGPWITPAQSAFDGLAYYAGKTASNGTDRYLFGWCPTRIGDGAPDQWGGSMVTHKLVPQQDGTLKVTIPQGFDNKFIKKAENPDLKQTGTVTKNNESYTLSGEANVTYPRLAKASKITATLKAGNSTDIFGFVFGACDNSNEIYSIQFEPSSNTLAMYRTLDGRKERQTDVYLPVPNDLTFHVKVLIEKSVCVIYVNDEIAFTNRMDRMNQNPWMIFSEKGNVEFSNIQLFN